MFLMCAISAAVGCTAEQASQQTVSVLTISAITLVCSIWSRRAGELANSLTTPKPYTRVSCSFRGLAESKASIR